MEVLYFQLDGTAYAIPQESIADVAPAGPIHPVPLAPRAVLGLAERRGRPVAVIDLPSLLDLVSPAGPRSSHLMRLAGTLDGMALLVPTQVFVGQGTPATSEHVWIDGRLHRLLDAEALVRRAAASC